jgi:hypothetical protein
VSATVSADTSRSSRSASQSRCRAVEARVRCPAGERARHLTRPQRSGGAGRSPACRGRGRAWQRAPPAPALREAHRHAAAPAATASNRRHRRQSKGRPTGRAGRSAAWNRASSVGRQCRPRRNRACRPSPGAGVPRGRSQAPHPACCAARGSVRPQPRSASPRPARPPPNRNLRRRSNFSGSRCGDLCGEVTRQPPRRGSLPAARPPIGPTGAWINSGNAVGIRAGRQEPRHWTVSPAGRATCAEVTFMVSVIALATTMRRRPPAARATRSQASAP